MFVTPGVEASEKEAVIINLICIREDQKDRELKMPTNLATEGHGDLNEAGLCVVMVVESRLHRGEEETDMVNVATLKKLGESRKRD